MWRAAAALGLLLAACGGEADAPDEDASDSAAASQAGTADAPAAETLTAAQAALLDDRDCHTVAQGYLDAIALRNFTFAAHFWNDGETTARRLAMLFAGYGQPRVAIAEVQEEGAAGSLYCTVTGALSDLANPAQPLREGQIVLRRTNDVPGATPEQLRWTIRSSTFIEPMERSGEGDPA